MSRAVVCSQFLTEEDGAVTVDMVPLMGMVVGLGLAVTGVVTGGVSDLARDIRDALNADIAGEGGSGSSGNGGQDAGGSGLVQLDFDDFTNGDDGWITIADEHDDPLLDGMLGPFFDQSGNPVVLNTYSFDPDTGYAMIEFDLTTIGNWEAADHMRMFVNGVMIDATRLAGGSSTSVGGDDSEDTLVSYNFIERESVSRAVSEERLDIANAYYEAEVGDSNYEATRSNVNTQTTYTVQVVVANPSESLQFGVGRIGDDPYGGEAWAIDNVGSYGSDILPVEFNGG
jgi:hypothetical protein